MALSEGLRRQQAYARIAHLFCETYIRAAEIGVSDDRGCAFPLTQADLGDATGLYVVHVKRVLMRLRADKLITLTAWRLVIDDWEGLAEAAGFNAAYLHSHEKVRARGGFAFGAPVRLAAAYNDLGRATGS